MTARQWASAAPHIAAISELGVRFSAAWAGSRLTPYIQKRFALEAACLAALEAEHEYRVDDVWAKLFAAAPKGHRYSLDAGAVATVSRYYRKWATFSCADLHPDRRRQTRREAPALLAAEAAYDRAVKSGQLLDAPGAALRVLVEQGLWPADGPLLWWPLPRERSDGDWLIGAVARLNKALERSLDLLIRADAFERAWRARLAPGLRGDAGALAVLAMAAGAPALTQGDVVETFDLSKKAAQKALAALQEAGAIVEITGRTDWRVWLANDAVLSAPLESADYSASRPTPQPLVISPPERLRPQKPDPLDCDAQDRTLKDAMADCDAASRRLRRLAGGQR